ncbi:hypothetical protein DS745_11630 [Anaerobacillus alkaliphilus]|uniref:PpiC domain-containing protein n=1 Tax=Anaerobacillus alkaliphilus TaxID=1548597 RepID=A0A4V1LGE9_9BACI|nr:peptidylprolyl isomerase [Anaerobacillus alkaliphilus]RXJ00701.1 hypothetical protein DS745_11630 [Anaerobacillus alkaliphilus]
MRIMKNILMALLIMLVFTGCSSEEENTSADLATFEFQPVDRTNLPDDKIVATFTGGEITGREFANFLAVQAFINPSAPINDEEYRLQIINDLIVEKSTANEVKDTEWAYQQLDIVWNQILLQYDEETIMNAYETLGINEDVVKEALVALLNIETYFREQITEEELNDLYEEVIEEFTTATFSHILIAINEVETNEEFELRSTDEAFEIANELYSQIIAGADLGALAIEHSDDLGSSENNGRYENITISGLVPEFQQALLDLEKNIVSEPVKTDYGYHLIRVEERHVTPLNEVKDVLLAELTYEKYVDYYLDVLPEYIIEINL